MAKDTDFVGENLLFLLSTFYLNEGKIKFLRVIQDTTRRRDIDTSPFCCTQLHAFWMTLPPPAPICFKYLIDDPLL